MVPGLPSKENKCVIHVGLVSCLVVVALHDHPTENESPANANPSHFIMLRGVGIGKSAILVNSSDVAAVRFSDRSHPIVLVRKQANQAKGIPLESTK